MSDQIYDEVNSDLDPFKKILGKIPGFKGYVERQKRRDADKLLRETVAARFEEQWQRLSSIQRDFISSGDISWIDDLESSAIKLRTFADRVRRATRGYSGLFDAVMINEEELAQLYAFDAQLLDLSDDVGRAIDNIQASVGTDGLPAAIRNLNTVAQQCIETFNRREEVFLGNPAG
ncbi:MAG TPA: hypothetical protein VLM80_09755 [Anaerolineales bacterium]|nr:hypothetical protein [Anaerolineales bacterium]